MKNNEFIYKIGDKKELCLDAYKKWQISATRLIK